MTYDEYLEELKKLKIQFDKDEKSLIKRFINDNNPYIVGDKITDHVGAIIIEKIAYNLCSIETKPCSVYFGIELKKDGTPKKKVNRRWVYQSNVIS
jgi:hypothetical protein